MENVVTKVTEFCREHPYIVGFVVLLFFSVVYGVFDSGHQERMWRTAMENGYEQRSAGTFSNDKVWVRVICKHCGSREFVREATASADMPLH